MRALHLLVTVLVAASPCVAASETLRLADGKAFVHPGILHTRADLELIKQELAAGEEPWKSGFERLKTHPQSSATWKMRGPFESVTRDPRGSVHNDEMVQDGNAAYQNALMWCITGEEAHAEKAVEILNAWSGTLKKMDGHDLQLSAGLNGFKFVSAAELIRYTYQKWSDADIQQFQKMLNKVIYPPLKDFATFANGNWDGACIKTNMAISVFCEDRAMFNRAVEYFQSGSGNGRLTHYIINETGQCQESGRDQQHTQLGLGLLAEACEIGWHQGLDMYGADDNRLLKGFEYTAKYNLGNDVPFIQYKDTTGVNNWKTISAQGRGRFRPVYEMVMNHYVNRRKVDAPFTKQAAEKIRPEGAGPGPDCVGFGTLLFSNAP
ncbi:MAG TPA: alginate lyase family protein [Planctomycetota bacterium]|nr:alginate lyase family protein [Planctomycetota bacterium]